MPMHGHFYTLQSTPRTRNFSVVSEWHMGQTTLRARYSVKFAWKAPRLVIPGERWRRGPR
jgi:hypothetical protein